MNKRKKMILSITGIIIVLLFIIAFSFGYVLLKIKGNENSILSSLTSKKVSVAYNEISNTSNGGTISPGYEYIKVFTATNDGNVAVNYHIYLDNVKNEFVNVQDITYTLYRSQLNGTIDTSSLSDSNIVASGTFPTTDAYIKFNEEIKTPNNYYTYALKINYAKTTESQNEDDGHTFSFRVQLDMNYPFTENTLAYNILNNAVNVTDEEKTSGYAEYMTFPPTTPAQEINGETESVLSVTQDDYGTSYYYRGNVIDNYVNFAGMCWRIVRIEGDGSVKITLAAQKKCREMTSSDTPFIGTGNYGYTYDYVTNSSGATSSLKKYVANYLNSTSGMKSKLDAWLTSSGIDTSKLKQDNWCLGNWTDPYNSSGVLQTSTTADLMYNGTSFYYDTYRRLYGRGTTAYATLKCSGNNYETYSSYIGALTADEVVFAGEKAGTSNTNYYLMKDNATSGYWWTLSPSRFNGSNDRAFDLSSSGVLQDYSVNCISYSARPAVTLTSGTQITSGDGTQNNPYIIG